MTLEETHDAVFGLVDDADDARMTIDIAMTALNDFRERWFDCSEPTDSIMLEIRCNYALIQAHLWMIMNTVHGTKECLNKLITEGAEICKSLK